MDYGLWTMNYGLKTMKKAIFAWSGGKDSALALSYILAQKEFEVLGLMTTLNKNFKRISMHGVKEEILDQQAKAIGIPLIKMWVQEGSYEEYERQMEMVLFEYKSKGVTHVIFGDIFLEDLKEYRDNNLSKVGLKGHYPLWKRDTTELIEEFLSKGFKTITCCINDQYLKEEDSGVEITKQWINALPNEVDPCGENGEFHTFCFDGPIFLTPMNISIGEKVYKPLDEKFIKPQKGPYTKGFWFSDLSLIVNPLYLLLFKLGANL